MSPVSSETGDTPVNFKLSLLLLAEELGNVSKACKLMGYPVLATMPIRLTPNRNMRNRCSLIGYHGRGYDRDLFISDAGAMIYEAAIGSLREIDRVATAALREAARRKRKLVERDAVSRVVAVARDD